MHDYRDLLNRRIAQFQSLLEQMRERRRTLTRGDAFLIIEERRDERDDDAPALSAQAKRALPVGVTVGDDIFETGFSENVSVDLPDEGWRSDPASRRFIQFCFCPRYFDIDIPNTTLYRAEAEEILRYRTGFFDIDDRPAFEQRGALTTKFKPFRKVYVYGDDRTAAEDTAFIFFRVWKFPIDWRFYVTAASFHDGIKWEQGTPLTLEDR